MLHLIALPVFSSGKKNKTRFTVMRCLSCGQSKTLLNNPDYSLWVDRPEAQMDQQKQPGDKNSTRHCRAASQRIVSTWTPWISELSSAFRHQDSCCESRFFVINFNDFIWNLKSLKIQTSQLPLRQKWLEKVLMYFSDCLFSLTHRAFS